MRTLLVATLLLAGCSAEARGPDRNINVTSEHGIEVRHDGEVAEQGSGNRVRQARLAGDFSRIIADDALDVEVRIGPSAAIEVEGDDNLIERIRTDAEDGTLHLRVRGSYQVRRPMIARITVTDLDAVELQASGNARISGLDGGRLELASFGSGSFDAEGRVDTVEVTIQGSGDADLHGLRARAANITINGSGEVDAHVEDSIVATINGSGEIAYRGEPRNTTEVINGTGNISRLKN